MRLGHVSTPVLLQIPSISAQISDVCNKACPVCPLSKQCKLPFTLSESHASHLFDLIHVDLWGPYAHETSTGCRYFLTIVDNHSRAIWTFLLPTKQHVGNQINCFLAYVQTHFKTSVKTFRCDHGIEFFNNHVVSLLQSKGISQQSSCVATPAQNGRVERKHRQLLSIARALRFQSGLPIKFWGECILVATHLINRIPTHVLHNKTPYECLYNKPPDYDMLKVFGCLCYASIHDPNKFSPRVIRAIFLGYPHGLKGYKLLNLDTHQQFTSRHVVFHETTFPFLNQSHLSTSSDPYFLKHWYTLRQNC